MRRQAPGHGANQNPGVQSTRRGHDVRHESGVSGGAGIGNRNGKTDVGLRHEHTVDLTEFDTEASNLDLEVASPDVLDTHVRRPSHDVAGAVHPRSWVSRVGNKAFCRQPRPSVISPCHAWSGQVQLAGDPDGNRLKSSVEHQFADAPDGSTDGDWFSGGHRRADVGHDRCFGRSVRVVQAAARCPASDEVGRARLAPEYDFRKLFQPSRVHRCQCRCGDERVRDGVLCQKLRQVLAPVDPGWSDNHRRPGSESLQIFEERPVETRSGEVQRA